VTKSKVTFVLLINTIVALSLGNVETELVFVVVVMGEIAVPLTVVLLVVVLVIFVVVVEFELFVENAKPKSTVSHDVVYAKTFKIWLLMNVSLMRMKGLGFLKYKIPNTEELSN